MTGAMYAAVSGLKAHMSALNVIGNNISNVNTFAYKATRYTFSEALYTTVRNGSNGTQSIGGRNPAQIGYGCSVGTIDLDMSTKNYNPTSQALDCMIDGDGFFLVGDKTKLGITDRESLQGMTLTRLGNFEMKDGYLLDGDGNVVYGFLRTGPEPDSGDPDEKALTSNILTPIRVPMCTLTADPTTGGTTTNVIWPEAKDGQVQDGEATDAERIMPNTVAIDTTGRITIMTSDEKLLVVGYIAIGKVDSPNGVTHVDGRYYQALDGAGDIHLSTIGGRIQYVPAAGGTGGGGGGTGGGAESTLAIESAGDTKLVNSGLESSGTDLAQEITNMIVIQRGYQANTRIVSVTDSMLEELVNMKR